MIKTLPKITAQDIDIAARTVWGESRGQIFDGMLAVMAVIYERYLRPGWWSKHPDEFPDYTISAACRDPWQFSAWNKNDPNLPKLLLVDLSDKNFRLSYLAVLEVIEKKERGAQVLKLLEQSTHYYNPKAVRRKPKWAVGLTPVVEIGDHLFFNNVEGNPKRLK